MNNETSVVSKSTTEMTAEDKQRLINGHQNKMDILFPLFDQITIFARVPSFITIIITTFMYLQCIVVSLWENNIFYSKHNETPEVLVMLMKVFWITDMVNHESLLLISMMIILISSIISLVWIIFELFYYHSKRTFLKWSLYVNKIIFDILVPVLIHPAASFIGLCFHLIFTEGNNVNWGYLVIAVICYIILFVVFLIGLSLNTKSVILSKSPLFATNHTSIMLFFLYNSCFIIVSSIISVFADWAQIIIQVVHFILSIYPLISVFNFPFYRIYDNAMFASVVTTNMLLDILMFILFFTPQVTTILPPILGGCFFVILCLIYYLVLKRYAASIKSELTFLSPKMTEEQKNDVFTNIGLGFNEKKAIKYLYVGMIEMADMFLDMSLTSFIAKSNLTNTALCSILQTTTFFPGEYRKLNSLFRMIVERRDLSYSERFMVYQINRIRILRASSVSIASNERLNELHSLNVQSEAELRSFWSLEHPTATFCEVRGRAQKNMILLWKEALDTYPNNAKISYEYSRFLAETITDFDGAIYQQQRGSLIEGGRNFAVDNSFRSFAREFPDYLLNDLVNEKGVKIDKVSVTKGSGSFDSKTGQMSGSQGSANGSTMEFTIDAEQEETIGKKILKYSRIRLALHHSIDDRKMGLRSYLLTTGVITFVVSVAAFTSFYVYSDSVFKTRSVSILQVYYLMNAVFAEETAALSAWALWASSSGFFSNFAVLGNITQIDIPFKSYVDVHSSYVPQIMNKVHDVFQNLFPMMTEITAISVTGPNPYVFASAYLESYCSTKFCSNSSVIGSYPSTFKDKLSYMLYLNGVITAYNDPTMIYESNDFCEIDSNIHDIMDDSSMIFNSFTTFALQECDSLNSILQILQKSAPYLLFAIALFPVLIFIYLSIKEIQTLIDIYAGLNAETKESAKNPIRTDADNDEKATADTEIGFSSVWFFCIGFALISISLGVLTFFYIDECIKKNSLITNYNKWFLLAAIRTVASGQSIFEIMNLIVLNDSVNVSFTNRSYEHDLYLHSISDISSSNSKLLGGGTDSPAYIGYDSFLDSLHFDERCSNTNKIGLPHDLYVCASISQQLAIMIDMGSEITIRPEYYQGNVDDQVTLSLFHLVTHHLWDSFSIANDRFIAIVSELANALILESNIFLAFGIIIGLFALLFSYYFVTVIDYTYSTTISLVKHILPTNVVASKELMDFLLNRKSGDEDKTMSIAQSIIINAPDAIICTGINGVIEIANHSVSSILGYTPDQLLGQPISSFFTNEDSEKVKKQMELLANGQSSLIYEDHFVCVSDSSTEIHFHTNIIGMKNEGSNEISSFVFILSDESELLKQQQEAEEAKAKSEKLLFQILPKDIVVRLNQGEKDISFSIPHATIIFIDIVKFSEYAASLTPQEIMGNLSTIFAAFDLTIAKYPLLTKIKLIGDVYMAAGGLFGRPDDNPANHAEDTVRFAQGCLSELDEINLKLNASLEIRIGINTGGPLLAGVLGTDKPIFDIIGDPINIAARLQSTDIPGKIQISAATKELLDSSLFTIEERGQVFLKGKGSQMTYLVVQANNLLQMTGSISNP